MNSLREIIARVKDIRTPQNVERAKSYFTKAKVDLESAKILYKKKIFDNSIFLFQQSVEKAAKCLYILYTGASESKLKEIRHESPLVFLKLFRDFSTTLPNAIKFLNPNWSPDFINGFDRLMKRRAKFARMNKKKIIGLVKIPQQILEPKSEMVKQISSIWEGAWGKKLNPSWTKKEL